MTDEEKLVARFNELSNGKGIKYHEIWLALIRACGVTPDEFLTELETVISNRP